MENTATKLRTRNNILHELCRTTWSSSAETLQTTAVGIVYSTAEYCAPWNNQDYPNRLAADLEPHPPADLRWKSALLREYNKTPGKNTGKINVLRVAMGSHTLQKNRLLLINHGEFGLSSIEYERIMAGVLTRFINGGKHYLRNVTAVLKDSHIIEEYKTRAYNGNFYHFLMATD
ncbi:hypothetical protein J437_LFUL009887, partial [Ladona fulva]